MARAGEDELIRRFFAPLAGPAALGLADDAALFVPPPGRELVLTADALVAGIHFFPDDPPASIGCKALGVNLSDLAAKGARPEGFLLTIALPDGWSEAWLGAFCDGLGATAREHACPLFGGDTVRTPGPLTLSITALGSVPAGRMVRRTSARAGEIVCVTGTIGDAHLGLLLSPAARPDWATRLSAGEIDALLDRYRHPQPRTALAETLSEQASAAMDVSDGLAGDLYKMLAASGVGGELDLDAVPLSAAAQAALAVRPDLFERLVSGGDDYEILFTLPAERVGAVQEAAERVGIAVSCIGRTNAASGLRFMRAGAEVQLATRSFSHF